MAVAVGLCYIHLFDEGVEFCVCQRLCQAVCNHLGGGHVGQLDSFRSNLISDIVVLDVNMLCSRVENRIVCQ